MNENEPLDAMLKHYRQTAAQEYRAADFTAAEEFLRTVHAALRPARQRPIRRRFSLAAGLVAGVAAGLVAGIVIVLLRSGAPGPNAVPTVDDEPSARLFAAAAELFPAQTGVVVIDGELSTFARRISATALGKIDLTLEDAATGHRHHIVFAGRDGESVPLRSGALAGSITPYHSGTELVLQLDLRSGTEVIQGFAVLAHTAKYRLDTGELI